MTSTSICRMAKNMTTTWMPTLEAGLAILASTNMKHSRWWRIGATLNLSDDARDARQSETRNFLQRTWGDDFAKNEWVRTVAKTLGPPS